MLRRIVNVFRSDDLSSDIDREMSFHVTERADELMAEGVGSDEAWRAAQRQFGNRDAL